MPTAADLAHVVAPTLENTPYRIVDARPDGFELRADLADARWWGLLSRSGTRTVFSHVVRVSGSGRYRIEQRSYRLDWRTGLDGSLVPYATADVQVTRGRSWSYQRRVEVGMDDDGRVGTVVDIDFSSGEGSRIVTDAARSLGMKRGLTGSEKAGVVGAVVGGIAALGGIVIALVVALA
ncbi:hypothetical protein IF650_02430 [Cellulosimicrobium terreum]|nr:hypothetical protein [Cellulosimicrobium terreum]